MVTQRVPDPAFNRWPAGLAEQTFVVVDLETTGGSAKHDRILEIAAVRVVDGAIRSRWRTFVNPGAPIPPFITGLTGITTAQVAYAPSFADVVADFRRFLGDGIFVAHQAAFDAGFLAQEYRRLDGGIFEPDVLCTLKLSRRLYPGLPSHSLEALIRTFGLESRRLHRALPDALSTAEVLIRLIDRAVEEGLTEWEEIQALLAGPKSRRSAGSYERARLKELPEGPGVYLLKDAGSNVFYVGKSIHVRRRVREHLSGKAEGQPKLRRHLKALADVQAIPTGSELEALLLEAKLIKQYLPVANQMLREATHYPFIRVDVHSDYPRIEVTRNPVPDGSLYFGPFRSARLVGGVVDYLRGLFGIRECSRSLLPDGRACLLLDLKKCLGPCVGAVSPDEYRPAVAQAVDLLRGEWDAIGDGLEAQMLELAEREQFEAAADIRDTLADLRAVVGTQRRLTEMGSYHGVIVTRPLPSGYRLLFVRGGRVAGHADVATAVSRRHLGLLLRRNFGGPAPGPLTADAVDEAWILGAWIRQHANDPDCTIIDVMPDNLKPAIGALEAALLRLSASEGVGKSVVDGES